MKKNKNWNIKHKFRNSNMRKRKKNAHFCFIMLFSLVVSSYSTSDVAKLENDFNSNESRVNNKSNPSKDRGILSDSGQELENQTIGVGFFLFSILIHFLSTILLSLIWNYLNNASITKRCLLLYLYQDAVAITLIASYVWFGIIISCYANPKGFMTNLVQATVLSICLISSQLALILVLNLVSIIKLYTMKEKVIDPPMPWEDDDDQVIKKFRTLVILSITLFVSVMYAQGLYPKAFYYLIGDHTPILDLSNGPKIFECVLGILVIAPTITIILTAFYRQTEEQALETRREGKVYLLIVTFILIMVSGMVYGAFSDKMGSFLTFGQCLATVAMVVTPCFIILSSQPLKSFAQKVVLNFSSSMLDKMNNYYRQTIACIEINRRSRQIAPIV